MNDTELENVITNLVNELKLKLESLCPPTGATTATTSDTSDTSGASSDSDTTSEASSDSEASETETSPKETLQNIKFGGYHTRRLSRANSRWI